MGDRRPTVLTALIAAVIWFAVYTAASLALGAVAGLLVAGDIDGRTDVAVLLLTLSSMLLASWLAVRWPRPVGAERWVLVVLPAGLTVVALTGPTPGTSAWPATVGSLLATVGTAALVRRAVTGRRAARDG